MRIHNLSYILLLSFFLCGYTAQAQKISSSVLQSDNYERDFPEPYYDSIVGEWIHPPYNDPRTGIVYEFQEIYADRDPYLGEYLYCYDDKIEPFGLSSDGKFYYAIHNYGYYEQEFEMPTQYFLVDIATNTLLFYDTIENKDLLSEHNIKLEARLKQFPLIINNDSGTLLEKIDINNYLNEREGQQSLTFSSIKKGEILIKSSEEIPDVDLGCPDEVKGYFLSPDKKYLIAVFYSNYIITGAGGDPCEGSIYLKVLDLEKFEAIEKDKSSDEVITRFWNPAHYDENRITEWLKNGYPYTISIDDLDLIRGSLSLDSLELLKDQIIIDGEGLGDPDDGRRWVTNMAKVYTSLAIISSGDQQSKYFQLALASSFINYDVNIIDFDVDNFMLYDYFSIIKLKLHLELKNAQNPKLTLLKIKEAVDFFDSEKGALLLQNMPEFKPDIDDFKIILNDYWIDNNIKPVEHEEEVVMTGSDSLIALLFPNADKDSLVNSIDSEIFSFFKEAKPTFTKSELKKLEKEKHILYKKLNDALTSWGGNFNEESWRQEYFFENVELGDADDGWRFGEDVIGFINRLAEVSLGKEKEVYLEEIPSLLEWMHHAECLNPCSEELNAMQELLRFQIQNEYNIQYSMESLNESYIGKLNDLKEYIKKNKLDEWIDYYGDGKDIIYLKRLLDLCSSGEINALITNSNQFPGTDVYELTAHTESPVYTYPSFQITTVPHKETNGYVITIGNIENESAFTIGEEWGLYFQGLIGHYMIIDEGTGTMRDLSVYDLQEQKVVFKNGYVGSLEVIEGKIHFLDQVQLKKESEKPECPQELIDIGYGIGYVEKLIYDIDKGKMKRTGEYQCWYFE